MGIVKDGIIGETSAVRLYEYSVFRIFDIAVTIPRDWKLRPDHRSRELTYSSGMCHFEKSSEDNKNSVSLGLLWETVNSEDNNETFIRKYARNMERQYQKQMKAHNRFVNHGSEFVSLNGINGCIMRISYCTSNALFSKRQNERIAVSNLAFLQESEQRRITATVITSEARMEQERARLEDLLTSIVVA